MANDVFALRLPGTHELFKRASNKSVCGPKDSGVDLTCARTVAVVLGGMVLDILAKAHLHSLTPGTSTPGQACTSSTASCSDMRTVKEFLGNRFPGQLTL
jgi:hypothetical protein